MRKKLDDEYWARAEAADRADNSLVGYESPAECDQGSVERPQHTFEIRTLPGRSANRASSSTATYRTRPPLVRRTIENPLTRLTKESLDSAEKAGRNRAVRFDLIKQLPGPHQALVNVFSFNVKYRQTSDWNRSSTGHW